MEVVKMRRSKLELIFDMLKAIEKGKKITHLLYKTKTSHGLLKGYIKKLSDGGIIITRKIKKFNIITLTPKGKKMLKSIKSALEIIENDQSIKELVRERR